MARRTKKHETTGDTRRRSTWFENVHLREWLSVGAILATLIIALVSLWNTMQISGLEDYFRSEVERRNSELGSQSKRADRLEAEVAQREARVQSLAEQSENLTAQNLSRSSEIQRASEELSRIRFDSLQRRAELDRLSLSTERLAKTTAAQARALEVLYRRRAFENLGFMAAVIGGDPLPGYDESPPQERRYGELLYLHLQKSRPSNTEKELSPYYERAKHNILRVCPRLPEYTISIPAIPAKVEDRPVDYKGARTQAEVDRRFMEDMTKFASAVEARHNAIAAINDTFIEDLNKAWDEGQSCICSALADEEIGQGEICPSLS